MQSHPARLLVELSASWGVVMERRQRPGKLQTKRVDLNARLRQVHELKGAPEFIVSKI